MDNFTLIDPEASRCLGKEINRQENTIELIASENFVYRSILQAQGSVFTNKYAEGYPGNRYHGGCENIDCIESMAIERACELFGADHANVQPHSGVNANLAVYMALIKPGDTILGMDLSHGGHLSHGSNVSITGEYYNSISYGVKKEDERIDYTEVEEKAKEYNPELIIAGASAYSREIDFKKFREIADNVDAKLMVDMAHIAGLVAAGEHISPVPYADVVTSTSTKTLRGARGGFILVKDKWADKIDKAVFPGVQGGPIVQNIFAKAITFKIAATDVFKKYQRQICLNAKYLANQLDKAGLRIVSGGTDNHLFLVDLNPWSLTGNRAEEILSEIGITVNKNLIPYDEKSPKITSGIRIGTAAITSRGFGSDDIKMLAEIIIKALKIGVDSNSNEKLKKELKSEVKELCLRNPLYLSPLENEVVQDYIR
ncbi:MAG: serine hydroxymethyltransferase [Bacillota bacterium]